MPSTPTQPPVMVSGSGGVRLSVVTEGDPAAPTVVLVHGYPDTHRVWDTVAELLATTHHVVRYDVRGAGESDAPRRLRAYRLPVLADDLFAVIDAVSPDRPVRVVGHDWGSVQSWEAVTDPRASGRIAGFTSISGPSLDHIGHWVRQRTRRPDRAARRQLMKSWYVYAFHVPGVPTLFAWAFRAARRSGIYEHGGSARHASPTQRRDARRGVRLYRANVFPRLLRPRERRAALPVQLVTLTRDRFVGPAYSEDLERWVPDLRRDSIDAGHWSALSTHASTLVALIRDAAASTGGAVGTAGGIGL